MNLLLIIGISFLLLVVGTLLGRYYTPDRRPLARAAEEGRSYVRSMVELLEGNNDKAIDEITAALKRNTKTVEAYFALGTLFRQRGEYERAVRVHQTLLVRRDVDKKTRLRVHNQLAQDFKAAGFPRRAIKALEYVLAQDRKNVPAMEQLSILYEVTGDWERATLIQRRLGKQTGRDTSAIQAHLLAELAHRALQDKNQTLARKALKGALAANAQSIHALHVLGLYQEQKGNYKAAAGAWLKAFRTVPDLAAFFVPYLERAFFEQDRSGDFAQLLQELLDDQPRNIHLRLVCARWDAKRNPERALAELERLLAECPNLIFARREAARLVLERGDEARIRQALMDLLTLLARADRAYRCADCGHTDENLFWRCPHCSHWGSVRVAWGRRSGEQGRAQAGK